MRLSRTKAGGILICGKIKPRMSPSWQPSPSCLPGVSKFRQEPTLQPGLEGSRSPVHTKPRNPGRGWKHETRLGWDVIQKFPPWTTAAFPCWGAMRQRGTHSSESSLTACGSQLRHSVVVVRLCRAVGRAAGDHSEVLACTAGARQGPGLRSHPFQSHHVTVWVQTSFGLPGFLS